MPNIIDVKATRSMLRELARIVKITQQALTGMIREKDWPQDSVTDLRTGRFSETLAHISEVREGFVLSQRTSPHISLAQLKGLVEDILLDWKWLQDLNLTFSPNQQVEALGGQLVVYNHALVAMSVLPRLPAEAITFPQPRPTYIDVAAPALPNEVLGRIEEIEKIIYQAEIGPARSLAYAPFRRTYAFFEASNWLINNYLQALLDD